jgi:hypothetical protein
MRKRAGPLSEISLEFAEIIDRLDEKFSKWTRQPAYRDEVKQVLPFNLTLSTLFYVWLVNKY